MKAGDVKRIVEKLLRSEVKRTRNQRDNGHSDYAIGWDCRVKQAEDTYNKVTSVLGVKEKS